MSLAQILLCSLVLSIATPAIGQQPPPRFPDSLRRSLARVVGTAVALGSEETMASGSFRFDEPGATPDDRLRLLHIPFKHRWDREGSPVAPFLGAEVAQIVVDEEIDTFGKPFDRSRTSAVNASLTGGVEWRLTEHFRFEPAIALIHSWLRNRFDYDNPLSRTVLEPVIDEIIVNWDLRALSIEPSAALVFSSRTSPHRIESRYRIAYIHTDPLSSSSDLLESAPTSASWIGEARVSLARPLPGSLFGRPLEVEGVLSRTDLGGDVRKGADMSHFHELDLALRFVPCPWRP